MIVKEVADILEELAPLSLAEEYDNVGLLLGDPQSEVSGILVTLDALENVVDEAISRKFNLIVTFHPIIFSGLKKITGRTYVERVVQKALKHNINIYSMHTALDNVSQGVNGKLCEVLGIENPQILIQKTNTIKKLTTYIPVNAVEKVKDALFTAGGGAIGNYSHCSFTLEGKGSFMPEKGSAPTLGKKGEIEITDELQLHMTFPERLEKKIVRALFDSHPYEEVAYEVITLDNTNPSEGMGMIGMLPEPMKEADFLAMVKDKMKVGCIRHSAFRNKKIQRVAVLGGSGAFAISAARAEGADAFVTSDLKYHQFFEAEESILLADIGHYESEQYTKNLLVDYLTKKIPNFAVALSESKTNPIKYY
ncbi:Nif3-like dinuclear metal center hexameric protein [Muriicola soli]|uniref:GTP cyclohydrolase 1 type 2 homolog n=1 Tax=Muriicola soli TaxID=2507538 RepID=A0A411E717_9FLAO|nr:Nif3-like dinuclear metal center hexameric protein [Muriicola soli]QBA63495.1 Nif3-like dinuclear metal center hexameric protein [Muriicola soli]